jgi:hypothetical protein
MSEVRKTNGNESKKLSVSGQVRQPDNHPVAGVIVRVFDKEMRTEEQLGETTSDNNGHYHINYSSAQIRRSGKSNADLIVRALNRDGKVLATSPLIFKAAPEQTIDLTLDGAVQPTPSEYERLLNDVTPAMQGTPLAELKQDDISFLSGETRNDALHIAYLVIAARRSAKFNVPAAAFYGLFRQDLPTRAGALLLQKPDSLRQALQASIQQNIIPASISVQIDTISKTLAQPTHLSQLDQEDQIPVLKILGTTTLPPEKQARFLNSFVQHDGTIEDFWQTIRQDTQFDAEQIKELQLTLQLGLLTQNHAPLLRELQKHKPLRSIASLRDLAGMEQSDWMSLVQSKDVGVPDEVPGQTAEEKSRNYVQGIMQLMETAFPSATVAANLARANRPEHRDVIQFFNNSSDFDLETDHIDSYLADHGARAFNRVGDKDGLVNQLKSMQRVFNITPRYEEMQTLLDDNLDSAYAIATLP